MELALYQGRREELFKTFLGGYRSPRTAKAYQFDLTDFFRARYELPLNNETIKGFLSLDRGNMLEDVLEYKVALLEKGLGAATINRRMAAIKSLVNYAYTTNRITFKLDIPSEKAEIYRDTRGPGLDGIKALLAAPDRQNVKGLRDYALIRLLFENALRRAEVEALDLVDFDPEDNRLWIIGKGKTEKEPITISDKLKMALEDYLLARGHESDPPGPLFVNFAHNGHAGRLSAEGIYYIIRYYSEKAGLKQLSPHKLRHSSITAFLDAGGNIREAQKLSRHAQLATLQRYDDNRSDMQGKASRILAELV